jgi:hypothetical protein
LNSTRRKRRYRQLCTNFFISLPPTPNNGLNKVPLLQFAISNDPRLNRESDQHMSLVSPYPTGTRFLYCGSEAKQGNAKLGAYQIQPISRPGREEIVRSRKARSILLLTQRGASLCDRNPRNQACAKAKTEPRTKLQANT